MAQILVRNLDIELVDKLKKRAKNNGRSLQAEVALILDETSKKTDLDENNKKFDELIKELEEFRKRFKGKNFSDSAKLIREDRR